MPDTTPDTPDTTDTEPSTVHEMLREFRHLMDERLRADAARTRTARRLAWTAIVLSLAAAVATGALLYFAFYQDLPLLTSPSITAREIALVDGNGDRRGLWTVDAEGAARLVLMDADGVARLKLVLKADGEQGISLADEHGSNRVVLGSLADQSSTLAFADPQGTTRLVLGMSAGEASSLLFADQNGGARAALGLTPAGEPTFWWPDGEDTGAADAEGR